MIIFLIIGLLLGAAVVIFTLQNTISVAVVFLSWQFQGSLALIIVLAVFVGVLLCLLFSLPDTIKTGLRISRLKDHNIQLQEEVTQKHIEVEEGKSKLAANNAYLDDLEKNSKI